MCSAYIELNCRSTYNKISQNHVIRFGTPEHNNWKEMSCLEKRNTDASLRVHLEARPIIKQVISVFTPRQRQLNN